MTQHSERNEWIREQAGHYVCLTTGHEVQRHGSEWFVTCPDEYHADNVYPTLTMAKQNVSLCRCQDWLSDPDSEAGEPIGQAGHVPDTVSEATATADLWVAQAQGSPALPMFGPALPYSVETVALPTYSVRADGDCLVRLWGADTCPVCADIVTEWQNGPCVSRWHAACSAALPSLNREHVSRDTGTEHLPDSANDVRWQTGTLHHPLDCSPVTWSASCTLGTLTLADSQAQANAELVQRVKAQRVSELPHVGQTLGRQAQRVSEVPAQVRSTGTLPVSNGCACTPDSLCDEHSERVQIGPDGLTPALCIADYLDAGQGITRKAADGSLHSVVGGRLAGSEYVTCAPQVTGRAARTQAVLTGRAQAAITVDSKGTASLPAVRLWSGVLPMAIDTASTASLLAREVRRVQAVAYVRDRARHTGKAAKTAQGRRAQHRRAIARALKAQPAPAPLIRTVRIGETASLMSDGRHRARGNRSAVGFTTDKSGRVTARWTAGPKYKADHSHIVPITDGRTGKGRPDKNVAHVWGRLTDGEQGRLLAMKGTYSKSRANRTERDRIVAAAAQRPHAPFLTA